MQRARARLCQNPKIPDGLACLVQHKNGIFGGVEDRVLMSVEVLSATECSSRARDILV